MPMTGRDMYAKLAAGCRRARLGNSSRRVGQLDLADRPLEPLVRGDLPPDRDQADQDQDTRGVVDRFPLELSLGPWPTGRGEREREADHAERDPDDRPGVDPLVLLAERPRAGDEAVAH